MICICKEVYLLQCKNKCGGNTTFVYNIITNWLVKILILLQEICVGILGNMACNEQACKEITAHDRLVYVYHLLYISWRNQSKHKWLSHLMWGVRNYHELLSQHRTPHRTKHKQGFIALCCCGLLFAMYFCGQLFILQIKKYCQCMHMINPTQKHCGLPLYSNIVFVANHEHQILSLI